MGIAPDPALFKDIVAYLLIASGWGGIYISGGVLCNTVYGKPIIPLPAPFVK
jgi:hypothetical protein